MKSIEELRKTPHLLIGTLGADGFSGEVHFEKWSGSVVCSWGGGWEHVSVCPYKHHITPSWDDMCRIKDMFWHEDECVVQYHPSKSQYVNNMPNCLHLWRPIDAEMPVPPSVMVGKADGQDIVDFLTQVKKLVGGAT